MKRHAFSIDLAAPPYALTDELTETLFRFGIWNDVSLPASRGCESLSSCGGVVTIGFDREAESLGDAVGSAIRDIEAAGFRVARVNIGEV